MTHKKKEKTLKEVLSDGTAVKRYRSSGNDSYDKGYSDCYDDMIKIVEQYET